MFSRGAVLILLFSFHASTTAQLVGDELVQPPSVSSSSNVVDTYLNIKYSNWQSAGHSVINGRLFNGTHPGPTIFLKPGDTFRIAYENSLTYQPNAVQTGESYKKPDNSNLHFHGLHVSGELPSDDIRLDVNPGTTYQYETVLPENHMPGTHWMHSHFHGSTSLQVSTGASSALIVTDPPGYLPEDIENAEDVLLFVHNWQISSSESVRDQTRDEMFSFGAGNDENANAGNSFRTVNGQYLPKQTMKANEWQRWRIVYSSWLQSPLDFEIDSDCDMYLLAKDGVYIRDYPRRISQAPINTAGRADVMVRCTKPGSYDVMDYENVLMTVEVLPSDMQPIALQDWTAQFPKYLDDLLTTEPDEGCSCITSLGRNSVNGIKFDPFVYIHTAKFGSVQERRLTGLGFHPFHQHIYPFQIIGSSINGVLQDELHDGNSNQEQKNFFKVGDWHDVLMIDGFRNEIVGRYRADVHDGRMFIHCHRLNHEDNGMMAQELIVDEGSCQCGIFLNATGDLAPTIEELTQRVTDEVDWTIDFVEDSTVFDYDSGDNHISIAQQYIVGDEMNIQVSLYSYDCINQDTSNTFTTTFATEDLLLTRDFDQDFSMSLSIVSSGGQLSDSDFWNNRNMLSLCVKVSLHDDEGSRSEFKTQVKIRISGSKATLVEERQKYASSSSQRSCERGNQCHSQECSWSWYGFDNLCT